MVLTALPRPRWGRGGAAKVLVDPPEVKQYAARGDPPIDSWPGTTVTRQEIMAACGDPRDWFRYLHRLEAYEQAWLEFADARRRRRNFNSGFDWNQILVLGDYGSKKTTLAIHHALSHFERGHAVFSNASALFGWHLEREEMYTALGFMPKNSILLIDESSAALSSGVSHGVAVDSFAQMNLNIRKRSCIAFYMSAQDWAIAPNIRRDCKEVWMPVPNDDLDVDGATPLGRVDPANDPDNFRLAWHVWTDYPYRKANLIEGKDANKEGFGPPDYTMYDEGELVRRAFLLNDTFELAQAGAARVADRERVKDDLRTYHRSLSATRDGDTPQNGARGTNSTSPKAQQEQERLLLFLQEHESAPPEFFTPGQIAQECGMDSRVAGMRLKELVQINQVRGKGYPSAKVYERLYNL